MFDGVRDMVRDASMKPFVPTSPFSCTDEDRRRRNKTSDAYKGCWMNETILNEAGSFCAQPGQAPALTKPSPVLDPTEIGGQGAWCVCASGSAKEWDYCQSTSDDVPEQINLQLAGPDTVVVSFVTFDESAPSDPPIGSIKKSGETGDGRLLTGVTHTYVTPSKTRVYYMHFVTFADLQPRAEYTYRVKSGGFDAKWSDSFTFRAPYAEGETNVAIFGDMGVYAWYVTNEHPKHPINRHCRISLIERRESTQEQYGKYVERRRR